MGNWSLTGILLIVGLFFLLCGFIFSQIHIDNPYTGMESSVLGWIGNIVVDSIWPW